MNIEKQHLLGKADPKTAVKAYRQCPSDFTLAANAACHYAKKFQECMVVILGNSYGNKVYHIAKTTDDLKKYAPGAKSLIGATVNPEGDVYQAILS